MADTYYLDNKPVDAPRGVDGLTLQKGRNPRYFAMLYRAIGYSNGVGGVLFWVQAVIDQLWKNLTSFGIDTQTRFRVVRDGVTQYDAYVDYSTMKRNQDGITVAFRDEAGTVTLETGANQPRILALNSRISVPRRTLGGSATHSVGQPVVSRGAASAFAIAVSVPLVPADTKTPPPGLLLPVSLPLSETYLPFYRNSTDRALTLKLSGRLKGTAKVSGPNRLYARLITQTQTGGSNVVPLAEQVIGSTLLPVDLVLSAVVTVAPGDSLALALDGQSTTSELVLTFDALTTVALVELAQSPSVTVPAIRVYDALASLISSLGASLVSSFFDTGEGSRLYLTDGRALRGDGSSISVSLEWLFEQLSASYCLAMWPGDDSVWYIEPRLTYLTQPAAVRTLATLSGLTMGAWVDYQPTDVTGGFATWRGKSSDADQELLSARRWVRSGSRSRSPLDIQSKLIASGVLIEEQIRKGEEASTTTNTEDTSMYVVDLSTSELNANLLPETALARWGRVLPMGTLLRTDDIVQAPTAIPVETSLFRGWMASVDAPCTMAEYASLPNWVRFQDYDGAWLKGLVMDARWRETDERGETLALTLLL